MQRRGASDNWGNRQAMMERKQTRGTHTIKSRIMQHQSSVKDWEYAELAKEMARWVPIFNKEWGLDLPVLPLISYRGIRNAYGTYAAHRGELGLPDTITMNVDTLNRPTAHIIRTLGHEMLHLWQQYHGKPTSENRHHNKEFVAKAKECGLLIGTHGCTAGHTEAFSQLIEKHGIRLKEYVPDTEGGMIDATGGVEGKVYGTSAARGAGSKMKKWTCGCTIVRCAVELQAACEKCGNQFEQEGEKQQ